MYTDKIIIGMEMIDETEYVLMFRSKRVSIIMGCIMYIPKLRVEILLVMQFPE